MTKKRSYQNETKQTLCTVNVNSSIQIRGKIRRFVFKEFVKLSDEQETDEKTKKEETLHSDLLSPKNS